MWRLRCGYIFKGSKNKVVWTCRENDKYPDKYWEFYDTRRKGRPTLGECMALLQALGLGEFNAVGDEFQMERIVEEAKAYQRRSYIKIIGFF